MKKIEVVVVFGGASSEYEVSLQSAYSVLTALDETLYKVHTVGISRTGDWYYYTGTYDKISEDGWLKPDIAVPVTFLPNEKQLWLLDAKIRIAFDVVFPVLHGKFGEDGTLQGLLDLYGIPYVGCGTLASALCMDKHRAHQLVGAHGIRVPKSLLIESKAYVHDFLNQKLPIAYPIFVKPVSGGSSMGISKVEREDQLEMALALAFEYDDGVVIEEAIDGFEVGCAILGNHSPLIGTVDEIELIGGFFDFTTKYKADTARIHVPARISPLKAREVQETALEIYRALGCRGLSRVDLFLMADGTLVFNEVNTMPGLTVRSRFPKMLEAAGYPFNIVLEKAIQEVIGHEYQNA